MLDPFTSIAITRFHVKQRVFTKDRSLLYCFQRHDTMGRGL